ncbi:pyridoxal phosphate-dependent aminotransferase [Methanobrevibacter olleyae]|uniref:Aminotransferase n=1 Tax=Methanobrevibacter olleyae TaxID=294671 RepID=A0A126QYV2_METOL|nr:pyridoxal phosphate-dependent aminotransferase [Methanobrevibacter olleyae]AMK14974.1 aminotransferase [Methanobrevibacter olleyae]SFL65202.1 aspartate aminotransferase [Methanobrevibacter olleyae]
MLNSAKRVEAIELSQIRKMFELTNPDAINLGIGEPDFNVPENIRTAMKRAIDEGYTKYTHNKGFIELREAIVDKLAKENNIKTATENIIVTSGASEALYDCAQALFEKGDNVLVPNPGFLSYAACVRLAEANVVEVSTPMENEFKMKVEDVQEKIDKNTKALIINSPSNPTGAVMDKKDIKGIADLATDHDFYIISDEIYEKIIYGRKNYSPAEYSDNVITINGFSKTYAMTGLRIAYMAANEEVTENLLKVHQYCTANASSISQMAAIEALTGPQESVKAMVYEFSRRRDLIVSSLNDMGYETVDCKGAFYVFPKVERANDFLEASREAGVIAVPGTPFGSLGENHLRMSYANSYENIEKAMDILKNLDY